MPARVTNTVANPTRKTLRADQRIRLAIKALISRAFSRFSRRDFSRCLRARWEIAGGKRHHAFSDGAFSDARDVVGYRRAAGEVGNRRGQKTPRIFRWSFFRCPRGRGGESERAKDTTHFQMELIGQLLQLDFPEPHTRTIRAVREMKEGPSRSA